MNTNPHLLFLTNFSEACFQALPAISEWIDREQGRLTLLNVARGGGSRDRLRSFFAEADRYAHCERVSLKGEPAEAIIEYCRAESPDVVFAPASKPSGVPRIFHRSLRASLIRRGLKLWTRGRSEGPDAVPRRPRNVAYAITGHARWATEVVDAARFAASYNATLHLLYLAPWPEVHDGTFAADLRATHPRVSPEELETLVRRLPGRPEVHASLGNSTRDVVRLLRHCCADVAFVNESHAIRRRLFHESIQPDLDRLDCEVFCYPTQPLVNVPELILPQPRGVKPVVPQVRGLLPTPR
jgi:hypothetical protein